MGNPKDNREALLGRPHRSGSARFRSLLRSEKAQADLDCLAEHARASRVAVLCFEKDESRCHQQVVLETVRSRVSVPVNPLACAPAAESR
ncbi:DUF488 family protein [Streptomyces sp. NPDC059374]|uniref:DUF488 family protein, N3 subclade n=1 Tax=Streptomyces sp. NPDC059374 TaxID=3346814 RepID=UPI00369586C2